MAETADKVIEVEGLVTGFGRTVVHEGLDLEVRRGEIFGIIGGSGSGKSVLLRSLIMLLRPRAGRIRLFGRELAGLGGEEASALRARFGVMFQRGALFSGLTVIQNVGFPLRRAQAAGGRTLTELACLKLALVGLPLEAGHRQPAELSGGMIKRAAIARALALDPELLFLDEPSAGLDPVAANELDELILQLKRSLGLTVVMITHDLDSLWRVTDRVAFLAERRIVRSAPMAELSRDPHPAVAAYFQGPRGRAARG